VKILDNPLMRFLSRFADMMFVNILFILFCIPVITIGAATSALYTVTMKMARNEEGYIFRTFWNAFKGNFKAATIVWLIQALLGALITFNLATTIANNNIPVVRPILIVVFILIAIVFVFTSVYVYPMIARYHNGVKEYISNAFRLSIGRLPYTLLLVVLQVGVLIVTFLDTTTVFIGLIIWFFVGFALIAFLASKLLLKAFTVVEPTRDEVDPDEDDLSFSVPKNMSEEDREGLETLGYKGVEAHPMDAEKSVDELASKITSSETEHTSDQA